MISPLELESNPFLIHTICHQQLIPGGTNALSNYRPTNLLIEIPGIKNIDNRLGVKNLVTPGKVNSQISRPKVVIDHWSANNGSIIYAQPNCTRSGSTATLCRNQNNIGKVEQQPHTTNVKVYSMHLNVMNRGTLHGKQQSLINGLGDTRNNPDTAQSTFKANLVSKIPALIDSLQTNGSSIPELKRDDLNQTDMSKWSNGTSTTSDLLF